MSAVQALQCNIPLAKVELLDSRSIQAVNDYSKTPLEEKPTLFLEFQGSESAITEQRTMFFDIAEENRSIRCSKKSGGPGTDLFFPLIVINEPLIVRDVNRYL